CSTRVAAVIRAVKLFILLPGWGNWARMVPQGRQADYRRLTIRRLYAGAAVPTDGGGVGGGAGGAAHVPAARATGRVPVRPASSHRFASAPVAGSGGRSRRSCVAPGGCGPR